MDLETVAMMFRDGMYNEIFHSDMSEEQKDRLVEIVKSVEQTVLDTIKAAQKSEKSRAPKTNRRG